MQVLCNWVTSLDSCPNFLNLFIILEYLTSIGQYTKVGRDILWPKWAQFLFPVYLRRQKTQDEQDSVGFSGSMPSLKYTHTHTHMNMCTHRDTSTHVDIRTHTHTHRLIVSPHTWWCPQPRACTTGRTPRYHSRKTCSTWHSHLRLLV